MPDAEGPQPPGEVVEHGDPDGGELGAPAHVVLTAQRGAGGLQGGAAPAQLVVRGHPRGRRREGRAGGRPGAQRVGLVEHPSPPREQAVQMALELRDPGVAAQRLAVGARAARGGGQHRGDREPRRVRPAGDPLGDEVAVGLEHGAPAPVRLRAHQREHRRLDGSGGRREGGQLARVERGARPRDHEEQRRVRTGTPPAVGRPRGQRQVQLLEQRDVHREHLRRRARRDPGDPRPDAAGGRSSRAAASARRPRPGAPTSAATGRPDPGATSGAGTPASASTRSTSRRAAATSAGSAAAPVRPAHAVSSPHTRAQPRWTVAATSERSGGVPQVA